MGGTTSGGRSHLRAEFPEEFKDVVDLPEFFRRGSPGTDKVVLVAERGAFMGACDICRGWYEGESVVKPTLRT